jgi:hypothetical protein
VKAPSSSDRARDMFVGHELHLRGAMFLNIERKSNEDVTAIAIARDAALASLACQPATTPPRG